MKIILFNPNTLDAISTQSQRVIEKKVSEGYLIVGSVEGWNVSVKSFPSLDMQFFSGGIIEYSYYKQKEQTSNGTNITN